MKVIVIGTGTIGHAVRGVLIDHGENVISVGRTSGDRQADLTEIASLRALFSGIGEFDAVANAAGDVFPTPLEQTTDQQWTSSVGSKGLGQINLAAQRFRTSPPTDHSP
jgi:nucleoside-diphosphate-sugar epimerase